MRNLDTLFGVCLTSLIGRCVFYSGCYLSTDDRAFKDGIVGKHIRERFPDKCKYEL